VAEYSTRPRSAGSLDSWSGGHQRAAPCSHRDLGILLAVMVGKPTSSHGVGHPFIASARYAVKSGFG